MKDLILLKIGGSIITDKSSEETIKENIIKNICDEIKEARPENLIIGHGAGSFGHIAAKRYGTNNEICNKDSAIGAAIVQDQVSRLNRTIVRSLIKINLPAISSHPSSMFFEEKFLCHDITKSLIDNSFIPVFHGDVIQTIDNFKIMSTEEIFLSLASEFNNEYNVRIIIATDVDGLMDKENRVIKKANSSNIKDAADSLNPDVTGGMKSKTKILMDLCEQGIESIIINGNIKGRIKDALLMQPVLGTRFSKNYL